MPVDLEALYDISAPKKLRQNSNIRIINSNNIIIEDDDKIRDCLNNRRQHPTQKTTKQTSYIENYKNEFFQLPAGDCNEQCGQL